MQPTTAGCGAGDEATGVRFHLAPGISSFSLWLYVTEARKKNDFNIQIQGEPIEDKVIRSMNRMFGKERVSGNATFFSFPQTNSTDLSYRLPHRQRGCAGDRVPAPTVRLTEGLRRPGPFQWGLRSSFHCK